MTMRKRPLGTTGMSISTVGFGAWAIGGAGWKYAWGAQDDDESIATIRYAVESGVNWIDTAAVYGLGHSEEVVGKAIAPLADADRPYLFTKCGLVWDDTDRTASPRKIMKAGSVRREMESSLRRLGVEQIDLYQVHWPGDGLPLEWVGDSRGGTSKDATPLAEYWQTMADLKAEGKVRAIALSNHSVPALKAAEQVAHIDAIQPQFSALARQAAPELDWCAEHGTGAIVYQPMHSGLLAGAFSVDRVAGLPDDDWRKGAADFTTHLDRNLRVTEVLRTIADRHGVSVASVSVAWTLAWRGVTGAIVGARNPGQVDGWTPAASLILTSQDHAEVAEVLVETGAGDGPTHPENAGG